MRMLNTKPAVILHKSQWAVTQRTGNMVQKIFLHDAGPKIQREVSLLKLSLDCKANLWFEPADRHWVCESPYLKLHPLTAATSAEPLIDQLKAVFTRWEIDRRYAAFAADDWSEHIVPQLCGLLEQYVPGSEEAAAWLRHTRGEHFVHGDFTLSNVYLSDDRRLIVLDFENAVIGPLLWDETTLVYSFIEQKQYHTARQLFEAFSCSTEMLRAVSGIRLARALRKSQSAAQRAQAHHYILQNY